jgi:transcriptional regulator with XRE-family HTH domain
VTPAQFRAIRQRLGLTQAELAAVLGYHGPMAISQFERESNPRDVPPLLGRLMRAYDAGYRPKDWPKKD